MSRLDSFIRRLEAQRAVLGWAAAAIEGWEGLIIEIGLGNGRTYDHLRELLPDREIFVFERDPQPNPASMPPASFLVVGDIAETLPAFREHHGNVAVLIHADVTTGVPERDREVFAGLPTDVVSLAQIGAIIVSGWPLDHERLEPLPRPGEVPEGRYFIYRRAA